MLNLEDEQKQFWDKQLMKLFCFVVCAGSGKTLLPSIGQSISPCRVKKQSSLLSTKHL
jgi:hypothetical protein